MSLLHDTFIIPQGEQKVYSLNPYVSFDMVPTACPLTLTARENVKIHGVSRYSLEGPVSATTQEIARLIHKDTEVWDKLRMVRDICHRLNGSDYFNSHAVVVYGHPPIGGNVEHIHPKLETYLFDFREERLNRVSENQPMVLSKDYYFRDLIVDLLKREEVTIEDVRNGFNCLATERSYYSADKEGKEAVQKLFPDYPATLIHWIGERMRAHLQNK